MKKKTNPLHLFYDKKRKLNSNLMDSSHLIIQGFQEHDKLLLLLQGQAEIS